MSEGMNKSIELKRTSISQLRDCELKICLRYLFSIFRCCTTILCQNCTYNYHNSLIFRPGPNLQHIALPLFTIFRCWTTILCQSKLFLQCNSLQYPFDNPTIQYITLPLYTTRSLPLYITKSLRYNRLHYPFLSCHRATPTVHRPTDTLDIAASDVMLTTSASSPSAFPYCYATTAIRPRY